MPESCQQQKLSWGVEGEAEASLWPLPHRALKVRASEIPDVEKGPSANWPRPGSGATDIKAVSYLVQRKDSYRHSCLSKQLLGQG
jgi:hypothetical protein